MSSTDGALQQTGAERLAAFVAGFDSASIPSDARRNATNAVADCLGVTLAARHEPVADILSGTVRHVNAGAAATVVGLGLKTSEDWAALCNGTLAHALDYDDVSQVMLGHPSVVLVPAILAVGEAEHASGRSLVDAYVAGFEVIARLAQAMNPRHYARGWHSTSTYGSVGAAAAVARLLGLSAPKVLNALGTAASLAGGFRRNFGTMTKPLHAGSAARNGVVAARLAQRGFTSSPLALEGEFGFADLFTEGQPERDLAAVAGSLGTDWAIVEDGIYFKPWPCCQSTHRILEAVFRLLDRYEIPPEEVVSVRCDVSEQVRKILLYDDPQSPLEGKFSAPYCVSAALLDGRIGIDTFFAEAVSRPAAKELGARVALVVQEPGGGRMPTRVTVTLSDGKGLVQEATYALGHPRNPLSQDQLESKFVECASGVLGQGPATDAAARAFALNGIDDVSALVQLLSGAS